MDTQRLILFMLFTFSVFFLMDAWQKDKQPQPVPRQATVPGPASGPAATPVPTPTRPLTAAAPAAALPAASGAMQKGETVRVETDVFVADIDTAGGDLRRLELLTHRDTLDHKKNFVLLQQQGEHTYVVQSGLIGIDLPNHRTRYTPGEREVKLAAGADRVSVRLSAPPADGQKVSKIYTFHRGSYAIDVGYEI